VEILRMVSRLRVMDSRPIPLIYLNRMRTHQLRILKNATIPAIELPFKQDSLAYECSGRAVSPEI
jgi:hypothetical protein